MKIFSIFIIIFLNEKTHSESSDILFDSLIGDNYNMSSIYYNNYDTIKIKHITKSSKNNIICIFGVLVNERGIIIEKEILNWLLPIYNIYVVYQKYPGLLFEYPALKFSQWIIQKLNKPVLLYLHTKGAYNPHKGQNNIINLWMEEFTYPKNKVYIGTLLKNKADISLPYRMNYCTWFNGMFISKRAFDSIPEVPFKNNRHFYEGGLFIDPKIRIRGIIGDNQSPYGIGNEVIDYLNVEMASKKVNLYFQEVLLIGFFILIKYKIKTGNNLKINPKK